MSNLKEKYYNYRSDQKMLLYSKKELLDEIVNSDENIHVIKDNTDYIGKLYNTDDDYIYSLRKDCYSDAIFRFNCINGNIIISGLSENWDNVHVSIFL